MWVAEIEIYFFLAPNTYFNGQFKGQKVNRNILPTSLNTYSFGLWHIFLLILAMNQNKPILNILISMDIMDFVLLYDTKIRNYSKR